MYNNQMFGTLVSLGLNENEAKVYLSALSLGPTTVLNIAKSAEIKRTTVYSVIECLKLKGLIVVEIKGFKKKFVAENPEKLETILDNRKNLLAKTLPEFAALYNLKGSEGSIKYYEGVEGVKSVYESLLKDIRYKENYLVISHLEPWLKLDGQFFTDFIKRRAKLNINIRMLLQDSSIAREYKKRERNFNERIKILPNNTSLITNLVIIPKKIVIHQLVPPIMAIVIENQSVVKMHQQLFEIMWNFISEKNK